MIYTINYMILGMFVCRTLASVSAQGGETILANKGDSCVKQLLNLFQEW